MCVKWKGVIYRVFFSKGPTLKVLSVGDGKIPTKKVKVRVCHIEYMKIYLKLSLF